MHHLYVIPRPVPIPISCILHCIQHPIRPSVLVPTHHLVPCAAQGARLRPGDTVGGGVPGIMGNIITTIISLINNAYPKL